MKKFYKKDVLEVGVDEVARGCLAGPVVSAGVIWPNEIDDDLKIFENQIKDSKKLSRNKRKELRHFIEEYAIDFSVSFVDNKIIDQKNILNATYIAMHDVLDSLNTIPELILVDGNSFKPYYTNKINNSNNDSNNDYKQDINYSKNMDNLIEHICIKGGDNKYISIACASILAKEYHDDYIKKICESETDVNRYDWQNNMCYGTKKHIDAIKQYGLSKYHRKTFGLCKEYI